MYQHIMINLYFYIMVILGVLFAQYALEMRKVPETLTARQETWAYQVLSLTKTAFDAAKQLISPKETTEETNDSDN